MKKYVIIGASAAGLAAAEQIRKTDRANGKTCHTAYALILVNGNNACFFILCHCAGNTSLNAGRVVAMAAIDGYRGCFIAVNGDARHRCRLLEFISRKNIL